MGPPPEEEHRRVVADDVPSYPRSGVELYREKPRMARPASGRTSVAVRRSETPRKQSAFLPCDVRKKILALGVRVMSRGHCEGAVGKPKPFCVHAPLRDHPPGRKCAIFLESAIYPAAAAPGPRGPAVRMLVVWVGDPATPGFAFENLFPLQP